MSDSTSSPPPLPPERAASGGTTPPLPPRSEPRVADFWQRAQALMALEHGMTPACQMKLATLARELRLTDDEYQEALERLRGGAGPASPPSPREQRAEQFREYVDKKLAKLDAPMLDFARESRWIAKAAERFELDAETARRTVESAASIRGVRRVTRDEARALVEQMVAEKVQDLVWLDHAAAQRLIVAGQVWGLSATEVDEVIRRQTRENRERLAAEKLRSRLLVFGAVATAVGLAAAGFWLAASRRDGRGPVAPAPSDGPQAKGEATGVGEGGPIAAPSGETPPVPPRAAPPSWWDGRLAVAIAQARTGYPAFRAVHERLASDRPDERGAGYEGLVAWSAVPRGDEESERSPASLAREIAVAAYAAEPDESAATRLRAALVAPLARVTERAPRGPAEVHAATWAAETAVQAASWPDLAAPRGAALRAEVGKALEASGMTEATGAELRREWLGGLARGVLRRASERAASDPGAALDLHDAVRDAADQLPVDELRRLQTALLAAALPAAGERWGDWKHVTSDAISTRDPLLLAPLVELYERGGTAPWRTPLGEQLRARSGTAVETKEPAELARAIREALGLAAAPSKSLPVDAWNQLRAPVEAALAKVREDGDEEEWLLRAVDLAYWGTLAAAAAHGDAGRHVWELAWREGQPERPEPPPPSERERIGVFGPIPAKTPPPALTERIANVRRAQVQRMAGALEHFDRLEALQRLNHLRGLAMLVAESPDVTPAQGQNIARYVLSARPDPEGREMRDPAKAVATWPQVKLGLADHVSTSKLDATSLAGLLGAALGRTVTEEEAERGREALRRELLANVLQEIAGEAIARSRQVRLTVRADEATARITSLYVRRAALWAFDASTIPEPAPGVVVAALSRHLASRGGGARRDGAEFARQAAMADYQSASDLHRLVAWERILVRQVADEVGRLHPDQAAEAIALVARELDGRRATGSLVAQYARLEALQLQLWMLAARSTRSGA